MGGLLALGIIGLGVSILGGAARSSQSKKALRMEAKVGLAETEIQLAEAGAKKGALEEFLTRMPTALQPIADGTTGDLEFDTQYRALLENYGNVNVLAGLSGQVGAATSQALGTQAEQQVTGFVDTQREVVERQIDIYSTTLEKLGEAKEAYEDVLGLNRKSATERAGISGVSTGHDHGRPD